LNADSPPLKAVATPSSWSVIVRMTAAKARFWASSPSATHCARTPKDAIRALHAAGVQSVMMLSGDNQRTVDFIAKQVGIDDPRGDLACLTTKSPP
jgi:cation transport ATPase